MKKGKTKTRAPRLQPYFVRRIALVLAGLWLLSMLLLTVGTARKTKVYKVGVKILGNKCRVTAAGVG